MEVQQSGSCPHFLRTNFPLHCMRNHLAFGMVSRKRRKGSVFENYSNTKRALRVASHKGLRQLSSWKPTES